MTLLVAIGNTLRRDDGAGARVLDLLGPVEGAAAAVCEQLTPELAEDVARADTVIFIDADVEVGPVRIEPLAATAAPLSSSHSLSPGQLVAVAALLYSFRGEAWLCRVPGEDFGAGIGLSARAEANAACAARLLRERLRGGAV